MKLNKILIIAVLIIIFTVGAVNAAEDVNTTDDTVSDDVLKESADEDIDDEDDDSNDEFLVEFPDEVEDEEDTIDVELPDNTNGNLTVKVNDSQVNLKRVVKDGDTYIYINDSEGQSQLSLNDDEDSFFSIVLSTLNPGAYNIGVFFNTSAETYSDSSDITVFDVQRDDGVSINVNDPYIRGQSNQITIDASQNLIDDLYVTINGISYDCNKIADQQVIDISKFAVGQYTIVVSYNNGKNSTSEDFEVVQGISYPDEMEYASSAYVTLSLDDDANGNLIVKIDNKQIDNVKLVFGEAKVKIPTLSAGIHTISAEYTGSDVDIDPVEDEEFEVFPKVTYPREMNAGEKKYFVVEVGNTAGRLTIETDEKIYASRNINGKTSIGLANLDDEEYTLTVSFRFNDGTVWSEDYDITVNSVPARIVGAREVSVVYSSATSYKLTVHDTNAKLAEEGELVEFKLNNKMYDAYIGKNGVVNFKIPNLNPGKYSITAVYDDEVSFTSTLTVTHLLVLKKVKIKKSADKLVIKASLKKVNGKYLKGKKITLKFKGKKYVAKTKKNGVAKFTISKKVLKKLKKGKTVTYKATYLNDSVKYTVKVYK